MRDKLIGCVLVMLLWPHTASAETGAVIVVGSVKPRQREIVETAVADVLRASSWDFAEPALTDNERDAVVACTNAHDRPWSCVAMAANRKALDRVVVIEIRPDKTQNDQLAVTAQIVAAGNGVATIEGTHCARQCSEDNLRASATEVVSLTLKTSSERHPASALWVRTKPEGAAIRLDGRLVGVTNRRISTTPGSHTVLLQRDGYQPATRTVMVTEGATVEIDVPLVAVTTPAGPGDEPRRDDPNPQLPSRVLPLVTMGVGLTCFVGGLLYSRSRDADADEFEQSEYVSSRVGIGVSIAGGIATVAGAVWLWSRWPRGTSRTSTASSSAPTVSITATETTFGWATTF